MLDDEATMGDEQYRHAFDFTEIMQASHVDGRSHRVVRLIVLTLLMTHT